MKTKSSIVSIIVFSLISMGICTNALAQSDLPGRLVGTVTATSGKTIYLSETLNLGVYSLTAFTKKDGKYVQEKAFSVKKQFQSVIPSVRYDHWFSSCPEGGFFILNKADKTIYIPLIDEYMTGADRYIVYRFDGEHFVYMGKDGGFWIHQSLRKYDILYALGHTKDFIVRIDRMDDGSFRYASWNSNKTMNDKPSIILYSEEPYDDGGLSFYNGDYKYTFDNENMELRVYEGKNLLRRQKLEVLYW